MNHSRQHESDDGQLLQALANEGGMRHAGDGVLAPGRLVEESAARRNNRIQLAGQPSCFSISQWSSRLVFTGNCPIGKGMVDQARLALSSDGGKPGWHHIRAFSARLIYPSRFDRLLRPCSLTDPVVRVALAPEITPREQSANWRFAVKNRWRINWLDLSCLSHRYPRPWFWFRSILQSVQPRPATYHVATVGLQPQPVS